MTDVRHIAGHQGEDLAAQHFQRLGFDVLARNHRTRFGELDLVAYDGQTLVFVEVKTRRSGARRASAWRASPGAAAPGSRGRTCTTSSAPRSAAWPFPG